MMSTESASTKTIQAKQVGNHSLLITVNFVNAILSNAAANIFMGIGMKGKVFQELNVHQLIFEIILSVPFIIGVFFYALALLSYNYLLSHVSLSMVYPIMTTTGFVVVIVFTHLFMGEMLNWQQWIGVGLVSVGVWLIASKMK